MGDHAFDKQKIIDKIGTSSILYITEQKAQLKISSFHTRNSNPNYNTNELNITCSFKRARTLHPIFRRNQSGVSWK